jgi:hypothetical protein
MGKGVNIRFYKTSKGSGIFKSQISAGHEAICNVSNNAADDR